MGLNLRSTELVSAGDFEYDEYGNIIPAGGNIFELDTNGDLMPTEDGLYDPIFEIDSDNNITPKL